MRDMSIEEWNNMMDEERASYLQEMHILALMSYEPGFGC